MTKLSKMAISKALSFDNNKVVSNSSGRSNKKLFKFKKSFNIKIYFYFFKTSFYQYLD